MLSLTCRWTLIFLWLRAPSLFNLSVGDISEKTPNLCTYNTKSLLYACWGWPKIQTLINSLKNLNPSINKGLIYFSDLFEHGSFMSFDTLAKNFDIHRHHFFRFLHVSFFLKHFPTYQYFLLFTPTTRGQMSHIYNYLLHAGSASLSKHRKTT